MYQGPGLYKHYKGGLYVALFAATDSRTAMGSGPLMVYLGRQCGTFHVAHQSDVLKTTEPVTVIVGDAKQSTNEDHPPDNGPFVVYVSMTHGTFNIRKLTEFNKPEMRQRRFTLKTPTK